MEKVKRHSSLRNRLKSSSIRRLYWAVAKRDVLAASIREESFYRNLLVGLRQSGLIFDIGANEGAKTDVFLRLGARVVAVEPDETCQSVLHDRFLRKGIRSGRVSLVAKAVSDEIGIKELWVDGPGSAVNSMSPKWIEHLREHKKSFQHGHCGLEFRNSSSVETTTIDDLMRLYGVPYFIKIDVEGHELNVLTGMRRPVPFASFEVNLCAFRSEGIECVNLLERLKADGHFNYTADCCVGFALGDWLQAEDFCAVLSSCSDESIEVFWRSSCAFTGSQVGGDKVGHS